MLRRGVILAIVLATACTQIPVLVHAPSGLHAPAARTPSSLPDPSVTPGAFDPRVTQENIHETVCVPGWSAKVRPPESITELRKKKALRESGFADQKLADYEWDHDTPIEVGGEPGDPNDPGYTDYKLNEWLQPKRPADGWTNEMKNHLENTMHRKLCDGDVTLEQARRVFTDNWHDGYNQNVLGNN